MPKLSKRGVAGGGGNIAGSQFVQPAVSLSFTLCCFSSHSLYMACVRERECVLKAINENFIVLSMSFVSENYWEMLLLLLLLLL